VDHAVVSGLPLPLTRFLLFNTDLFDEPEFAAPCCSGVLGIDLFRRYVLEFRAGKPTEVNLWKVSGFTAPKDDQWVELRENAKGEMVAICSDRVKALPHSEKLCQDPRRALREATGEMIFDLPHGLLWYSPEELAAPEYKNTSGLKLNYTYLKGDRVLVVQSIGRGTVAEQLEKAGLKKGMVITDIDDIPALDLDLWEVNRRLSGVYGDKVTLKWKTSKGVVTEPLQLLRREIRGQ
jgi:C-terminal processing protease CtpA/Prc